MKLRFLMASLAVAALAACGPPERRPSVEEPAVAEPAVAEVHATPPSFVGMWAVDSRLCETPAWRFEAREVSTLGEVHCDFNTVTPRAGMYAVAASCTAEAPPAPFDIQLAMTDAPRTMTINGGPWAANTRLVYCGPLTAE